MFNVETFVVLSALEVGLLLAAVAVHRGVGWLKRNRSVVDVLVLLLVGLLVLGQDRDAAPPVAAGYALLLGIWATTYVARKENLARVCRASDDSLRAANAQKAVDRPERRTQLYALLLGLFSAALADTEEPMRALFVATAGSIGLFLAIAAITAGEEWYERGAEGDVDRAPSRLLTALAAALFVTTGVIGGAVMYA